MKLNKPQETNVVSIIREQWTQKYISVLSSVTFKPQGWAWSICCFCWALLCKFKCSG